MVNIEEQSDFISGNKSSKEIIDCHSRENAIFSGAISAIPGPAGILTMIPELIFVVKTKVKMIRVCHKLVARSKKTGARRVSHRGLCGYDPRLPLNCDTLK